MVVSFHRLCSIDRSNFGVKHINLLLFLEKIFVMAPLVSTCGLRLDIQIIYLFHLLFSFYMLEAGHLSIVVDIGVLNGVLIIWDHLIIGIVIIICTLGFSVEMEYGFVDVLLRHPFYVEAI